MLLLSYNIRRLVPLGTLLLTGCVAPYIPPNAGATAKMNVTVNNTFGPATFDIASPRGALGKYRLLDSQNVIPPISTTTLVAADQPVRVIYVERMPNAQCILNFMFTASPGNIYGVYVGDISPPAAMTTLGKIGQFIFPLAGKGCFTRVLETRSDGSTSVIRAEHWNGIF